MQFLDPTEGWDWFVRKTRRTPVVWTGVTLVERLDGMLIRPPRTQTIGGPVVLSLFGGGCLVLSHFIWADERFGASIAFGFGVLCLLGTVVAAATRAGVSWDPYGRTLTLCSGYAPFVRTFDLPKDRLRIELSVGGDGSPMSSLKPGYSLLSLGYADRPGLMHLACVEERGRLDAVAERLGAFLGAPVQDHTHVPAVAADGETVEVDATPLGKGATTPRSIRLSILSPRVAVFRSEGSRPVRGFLMSGLAMGAVFALATGMSLRLMAPFFIMAVLCGLVAMAVLRATRRTIVADLQTGLISLGRRAEPVCIRDVAAVQTCLSWRSGETNWTFCEVNLVLNRPAGKRVCLVNDPDPEAAKADARRFADFLGVPLLDHTSSGAWQHRPT